MCCPLAPWRSTVEDVLKTGLKGVIQVLVKKCKTRHLLALSPKKTPCSCQPPTQAKRIRFSNLDEETAGVVPDTSTDKAGDVLNTDANKTIVDEAIFKDTTKVDIKMEIDAIPQEKTDAVVKKETVTLAKPMGRMDTKEVGTGTEESMELCVDDFTTAANETMEVNIDTTDVVEMPKIQFSKQPIVCLVKVDLEAECNLPTSSITGQETTHEATKLDEGGPISNAKVSSIEDINSPLKLLRDKYNLKDCSVCVEKLDKGTQHSDVDLEDKGVEFLDSTFSDCSGRSPEKLNSSLTPTDSGIGSTDDELKLSTSKSIRVYAPSAEVDYSSRACEEASAEVECKCFKTDFARPTLLSMEEKVENNEFSSLLQFDEEMEQLLNGPDCLDLVNLYHRKLKDIFPWFDPKHAQVSRFTCPREQQPQETTRDDTRERNLHSALEDVWVMPEYALGKSVDYYYSDLVVEDVRACALCRNKGDGLPCEEGRLLYCGQNEWAHANCALWSSEVFEEIDGSLQNVHSAVFRGRKLACEGCGVKGASVGCCSRNCFVAYHFPCARKSGCRFMEDKTFYCPTHMTEASGRVVQNHDEFDLRRPIYVELDRKKKKFVEPDNVKFMIGSLHVERLGVVVPGASDHINAIIPNEFSCTRLYWSSVEPWRIVQYTVKTVLPKVKCEPGIDHGRNVTINHELDQWIVRHKLEDIYEWHRQLGKKPSDGSTQEASLGSHTDEDKIARQVMDYMLDAVCSKDVYENCLSDPQNAAELLPPELKDAIFEDLPHDLLDGISMQDIFPKMMSFEDCFSADTIGECKEQLSEDALLNSEVEENTKFHKAETNTVDSEMWFGDSKDVEVSGTFQNECRRGPRKISKELKRSHSEVISLPITRTVGTRSHKRSCSLTWNCKLDSSKRRKVQGRATRSSDVTVDVTIDKSHKLHELRLPDGVLVTLARSTPPVAATPGPEAGDLKDSSSNARHRTAHQTEEGKENKCLLWHGRPRLAQLDGAVESSSSGSEGGSPLPPEERGEEKPVRCSRCHSTYRTRVSYERHLPTCSNDFILSTSESDSETRSSEGDIKKEVEDVIGVRSGYEIILPEIESNDQETPGASMEDKPFIFSDLQNTVSPPAGLEPQVTEQKPVTDNEVYEGKEVAIRAQPKAKFTYQRTAKPRSRPKNLLKQCNNIVARENNVPTTINHSIMPQSQPLPPQPMVQPTVIVQQVPSASMMPAYLESFQQQTGHNLQYIASIDIQSNGFNKPQYITNGIIPGTFQLQSTPDYGNLSLLPGVQIASQPTMLGTIIQQPTAAIQCGVVGQDQIVLGGTPLEVYTDQSGGMFLANQPMYYGLETIVSNTVMSSSQYVSGMPGMVAASSSYSATTTQVYQTNKIEPMMDPTSGYVIVPNTHLPNPNLNPCPNPVRMSLPSHIPPPVIPHSQPASAPRNPPWANACTIGKYLPTKNNEQHVKPPTPIHRPRPCYMPHPPTVKTSFQTPTRLKANMSIASSSIPDRTSSFKYTIANTVHTKKDYPDSSNRVMQMAPVEKVLKDSKTPSILKLVRKDTKETGELRKPAVVAENKPPESQQAVVEAKAQPTESSKSKAQSIKLVIQKSPQNGYYTITQHLPHNNVKQLPPTLAAKEMKQDCKPTSETKTTNGTLVLPLADNVKSNKTKKPAKRRWQPKEKPANQPKPPPCKMVYEVCSKDGFSCTSTSIAEVWEKVFEAVQSARVQHKMPPLLRNPFNANSRGLQMLGLNHNGLRYLVEQLPGANRCVKYRPLRHDPDPPPVPEEDDMDALPQENPSGCCRTEAFGSRAPYDLFSWLASRHRRPPKLVAPADEQAASGRRASSTNLPMAMRFRHLRETSKEAVGVYRSHIHGRGLFCLRDVEAGEMVIEYAGEVIRSTLTDYRERLYDDKDIGCYMFRIDDHLVVDATMRGNAARFINHSCEPNCYSKVVDILGKKHILIFALRRIPQGEELTYDYKFPFEDIKIPCTCGSRRCRKYLN